MSGQSLRCGVIFEGDYVYWLARRAGDGCDPGRVERLVSRPPFRQDIIIHGEGSRCLRLLDRTLRGSWLAVARLEGRMVLLGPFFLHWW